MTTQDHRPDYRLRAVRWPLVALFGALLADLAETLVDPANSGASAKVYTAATQHETRMIASALCLLLSIAFIVPAVSGLTRVLVARGRVLGRVAACFALLGAIGHAALSMLYLVWIQLPKGGADKAEMLALLDRITNAGPTAIVVPLLIAFPLAFLALYGPSFAPASHRGGSSCPSSRRPSARASLRPRRGRDLGRPRLLPDRRSVGVGLGIRTRQLGGRRPQRR